MTGAKWASRSLISSANQHHANNRGTGVSLHVRRQSTVMEGGMCIADCRTKTTNRLLESVRQCLRHLQLGNFQPTQLYLYPLFVVQLILRGTIASYLLYALTMENESEKSTVVGITQPQPGS